jgi:transcriptional regulator with XRE-family HTH domain
VLRVGRTLQGAYDEHYAHNCRLHKPKLGDNKSALGYKDSPNGRGEGGVAMLRYYNRRVSDSRWWQYVQAVTGAANNSEIAKRMDIDMSHMTRWKNGQTPSPPFVKRFAKAYNRNVLEAFVAAEYLDQDEAELHEVTIGAEDLTLDQLLEEIRRRAAR